MKKIIILIIILIFTPKIKVKADINLAEKLSGKILLQTQKNGEAWYVNPADQKRYFLSRPSEAFQIMRKLGQGITNSDLEKINNDLSFAKKHLGKIFLQTEKNGEAWYINPGDSKAYYLGRPLDAFNVMRQLSLGITNKNLSKISIGYIYIPTKTTDTSKNETTDTTTSKATHSNSISNVAYAIRENNLSKTQSFFLPELKKSIEYTMNFLDSDGRLVLGNILSNATLQNETALSATYKTEVYFSLGGYKVPMYFNLKKQETGEWLLTNL